MARMLVTRVYWRDGWVDLADDGAVLDYTIPRVPADAAKCVDVSWLQYCLNHCIIDAYAQFVADADDYHAPDCIDGEPRFVSDDVIFL